MEEIQEAAQDTPAKKKGKPSRRQSTPNMKNKSNKLLEDSDDKRLSCKTTLFGNGTIRQRNQTDPRRNDVDQEDDMEAE